MCCINALNLRYKWVFVNAFIVYLYCNQLRCLSDIDVISILNTNNSIIESLVLIAFLLSLAVNTPSVPFNVLLPRAHAEANLTGSMLLANIVFKLATFGYLRLLLSIVPYKIAYLYNFILVICILGIVLTSLSAIQMTDLKGLVAV